MALIEAWAALMNERWRAGLDPNLVVEVPYKEMLRMWEEMEAGISRLMPSYTNGIRGPVRLNFTGGHITFKEAPREPRAAPPSPTPEKP